ncbi:MAG: hypothetical protein K0Q90_2615 [Paenibacillaceae bacterium]|nr:hypothetical protein [Paenibacillaceae bacterium]
MLSRMEFYVYNLSFLLVQFGKVTVKIGFLG